VSKSIFTTAALVAVSLPLAACGSSSYSGGSVSSAAPTVAKATTATVRTAASAKLGTILVDPSGMTLYRLSGESPGKFICTPKSCLAVWHPVTVAPGTKPTGAPSLGVVTRPDGSEQVAYNGQPLYTFTADKPGQTSGQGLKDVGTWSAVALGGGSAASGGSGAQPASSGGGGYRY
jgi:predicted lipoprotein with Yx(FWY)xxD motif